MSGLGDRAARSWVSIASVGKTAHSLSCHGRRRCFAVQDRGDGPQIAARRGVDARAVMGPSSAIGPSSRPRHDRAELGAGRRRPTVDRAFTLPGQPVADLEATSRWIDLLDRDLGQGQPRHAVWRRGIDVVKLGRHVGRLVRSASALGDFEALALDARLCRRADRAVTGGYLGCGMDHGQVGRDPGRAASHRRGPARTAYSIIDAR